MVFKKTLPVCCAIHEKPKAFSGSTPSVRMHEFIEVAGASGLFNGKSFAEKSLHSKTLEAAPVLVFKKSVAVTGFAFSLSW